MLVRFSHLTFIGIVYTAYQAFHQDASVRQTVLIAAAAGLTDQMNAL
jgi:hypothetical protein